MKACKKDILDNEKACNIPASFHESVLARTGRTVEMSTDIPDAKVLEPLIETSKPLLLSFSFPGRVTLIPSTRRQILRSHPDHHRQPRFAKPYCGISVSAL